MGAVKASSLIALVIGGVYQIALWKGINFPKDIPLIVIGSSFVGMIGSRKYHRNFHLFIAPIIFTLIYHNISKQFNGFGGALGTAACISLLVSIYLRSLEVTKKAIKPFRQVKVNTMKRRKVFLEKRKLK